MAKVIDVTPNWEASIKMLIVILKDSTNAEDRNFAESELIRAGRIIDELTEDKK